MKTVALAGGERVPALGMGTASLGEMRANRAQEWATLELGLDLGLSLIDTAELYGRGASEELVGDVIRTRRDEVFLVSKLAPHNAGREDAGAACERSLRRLKTDRIDLYLLHWRGETPLAETLGAFVRLQSAGKIRHYGVSNFDAADMRELWPLDGGASVQANQMPHNLAQRQIEAQLVPWLRERHVPVIAYSPLDEGRLLRNRELVAFAAANDMTAAHAALGWLLAKDDVIVIPRTGRPERLKENARVLERPLSEGQLAELERLFPQGEVRDEL